MKLSTSLVAVKKIISNTPRSNFANDQIEQIAKLILQAEGVINPVVLCRTSLESYEVVDGDFEYYAAARAREIDPRKGEMIGAFIIEPENEESIKEQVKALRKPKLAIPDNGKSELDSVEASLKNRASQFTSIDFRLTNLESRLENRIRELQAEQKRETQNMDDRLKNIESLIPKSIGPLEVFNTLSSSQLVLRLKRASVTGKKAEKIIQSIESQRQQQPFESLSDVVKRVNGLSDKGMVTIIDSWSQISFK
ncbi:MAG: hypothetical protein JO235_17185 [Chroococcidiopsidaceae cyanobacterium CP_BM_RX_35]|nr:hypothetical protein [Chroococcidiopsidaceae cyanobacterium CP_BM_RX_35]